MLSKYQLIRLVVSFMITVITSIEDLAANYRELVGNCEGSQDQALVAAALSAIAGKTVSAEKLKNAVIILKEALTLKANTGGAIKRKIEADYNKTNPDSKINFLFF
jgi:hypothetical protein